MHPHRRFYLMLWLGISLFGVGRTAASQPTFRVPLAFPAGNEAETIAAADVDGDDDVDLAIASIGDGTISVLRNDGLGNYTVNFTDRVGQRPRHVLLEDIDVDGDPDLMTANQNSSNVSVLVNRGAGAFSMRVNYAVGATPEYLATADLDDDLDLDLVVASGSAGVVRVMRNVGGTAFQLANTLYLDGEIPAVALGDMDGDLDVDVVAVNRYLGWVMVVLNQGEFAFTAPRSFKTATQVTGVTLLDLDGDADLDVVTAHAGNPGLTVLLNVGDGSLGRAVAHGTGNTATGARAVKSRDLDADGDADLVVVNGPSSGSTLAVLFNLGAGRFAPPLNVQISHDGRSALPLYDAVIAACDAEPGLDIATVGHVVAPGFSGVALAYADPRTSCFAMPSSFPTGPNPAALVAADIDNDTAPDLVVLDLEAGEIDVHRNTGRAGFAVPMSWNAGIEPAALVAADFDADGDIDLATADAHPSTDVTTMHWNDRAGGFPFTTVLPRLGTGQAGTRHLLARDLDGDKDVDLVAADSAASRIGVLVNLGDGTFSTPVAYACNGHPSAVCSEDVDGDGDPDLLVGVDQTAAKLFWNAGDGTFPTQSTLPLGYGQTSLAVADWDMDGDLDIASALRGIGAVGVSLNMGGGTFAPVTLAYTGDAKGTGRILAVDVNGDGDMDLVCANRASGSITVLANDGAGGFALPVHFAAGSRPGDVVGIDLDGDSDTDVAVTNAGAGTVSLLLNTTHAVPVLLTRWAATETARGTVLLTWSVTDAAAVAEFRVERWGGTAIVSSPTLPATARAHEDTSAQPGVMYRYVLVAMDRRGFTARSAGLEFKLGVPRLQLLGAAPNPSTDGTTIRLGLPETMAVHVALYDVRGKRVVDLVDAVLPRGRHALLWSGRDRDDALVPAGVYLCRMRAGSASLVEKVVVAPRSPQR